MYIREYGCKECFGKEEKPCVVIISSNQFEGREKYIEIDEDEKCI